MIKPQFIEELEKVQGVLSVIKSEIPKYFSWDKLDKNKSLEVVYTESEYSNKKIEFSKKIYRSKSDFYVFVENVKDVSEVLNIYYKTEQLNEVLIFLNFINK